jgi:hypothetical protein
MKNWVVLTILASLAGSTLAQTEPAAKKKPPVKQEQKKEEAAKPAPAPVASVKPAPPKPPAIKFSMSMLESGRIDLGYAGIPVGEVVDAIEKMTGSKKGEFESTADYTARKAVALSGKFLGDSSLEDTFAFVVPVSKGGPYRDGLGYVFNADTSEVRLFVLPTPSSMNGIGAPDYQTNRRESNGLDQFALEYKIISQSTYEGSNAYGAKVTVEKTSSNRLGIAANRIPFLSFKRELVYSNPIPAVQFNLENARAAMELPALKALLVMQLAEPFIAYHFIHKEAKRDSPSEISNQGKFLTGNILGIVFYSGVTGEIFARVPDAFGRPEPKVETKPDDKPAVQ